MNKFYIIFLKHDTRERIQIWKYLINKKDEIKKVFKMVFI